MTSTTPASSAAAQLRGQLLASGRVVAVADTTAITHELPVSQFTNVDEGRVGVLARPGMRRIGWLAADLLAALGCREDVTGAGRPGEADWTLVAAWLATHEVRHVYIRYAWDMPLSVLEEVLTLLSRTGCVLWLVGDSPFTPAHADILRPWTTDTITGDTFLSAWSDLTTPTPADTPAGSTSPTAAPPAQWPTRVPDDDFTTFRSACRDLLGADQFALVDAHLRASAAAASDVAARMVAAGPLTEDTVAPWLQQHWETTETLAHYITFLRGAQVAFFRHGHHLQVDLDQLIGTAATMPRRALRTAHTWELLHAYPEPHRAAICALAAAGVSADDIGAVTLAGYQPGQVTVTLANGTEVAVEADALVYLTAQWHHRTLNGAGAGDLLFVGRNDRPLAGRSVIQITNDARRELAVAVAPARADRKGVTGDRWASRWGISIQQVA